MSEQNLLSEGIKPEAEDQEYEKDYGLEHFDQAAKLIARENALLSERERLYEEISFLDKKISMTYGSFRQQAIERRRFLIGRRRSLGLELKQLQTELRVLDPETHSEIFRRQRQEVMASLRKRLRSLDQEATLEQEHAGQSRTIFWDDSTEALYTETFIMQDDKRISKRRALKISDIVADSYWGISYQSDSSLPRSIYRQVQKTILLAQTKQKLRQLLDEELVTNGIVRGRQYTSGWENIEGKMSNYLTFSDKEQNILAGHIAEVMVLSLLTRIVAQNPELKIKIEPVNTVEDQVLKYDLKIVAQEIRGVAVEGREQLEEKIFHKAYGLQVTITNWLKRLEEKQRTIKQAQEQAQDYGDFVKRLVDDVLLIQLSGIAYFGILVQRWIREGKPSGGPEQYLTPTQKAEIVYRCLEGFLDPQVINGIKIS